MLQVVLLCPQLVPDDESVGAAEVCHGATVELSVCKWVMVRVISRKGEELLCLQCLESGINNLIMTLSGEEEKNMTVSPHLWTWRWSCVSGHTDSNLALTALEQPRNLQPWSSGNSDTGDCMSWSRTPGASGCPAWPELGCSCYSPPRTSPSPGTAPCPGLGSSTRSSPRGSPPGRGGWCCTRRSWPRWGEIHHPGGGVWSGRSGSGYRGMSSRRLKYSMFL